MPCVGCTLDLAAGSEGLADRSRIGRARRACLRPDSALALAVRPVPGQTRRQQGGHTGMSSAPLLLLHGPHRSWMLFTEFVPPRDQGIL